MLRDCRDGLAASPVPFPRAGLRSPGPTALLSAKPQPLTLISDHPLPLPDPGLLMKLRPPELDRANRRCSGLIGIPEFRLLIRAISGLISAPDLSLLPRYYFGEVYPLCKEQRYDVPNLLEFELCPAQHQPKSALKISNRVDELCFRFCSMLRDFGEILRFVLAQSKERN